MLSRFSQLKQSLSEELEQVVSGPREKPDTIATIERNAVLLQTATPTPEQLDFMAEAEEQQSSDALKESSEIPSRELDESLPRGKGQGQPLSGTAGGSSPAVSSQVGSKQATPSAEDDANLPIDIKNKLRKFAKYEEKYPLLLKAYRTEKKKGELVKLFDKVLAENTPCQSISEPQQMLDYLNGINSKNTLLKQELQKVSDELAKVKRENTELVTATEQAKIKLADLKSVQATAKEPEAQGPDEESLAELVSQRDTASERIRTLETELSKVKASLETKQTEISASDQGRTELRRSLVDVEEKLVAATDHIAALSKELEEHKEAASQISALESKLAVAQAALDEPKKSVSTKGPAGSKGAGRKGKGKAATTGKKTLSPSAPSSDNVSELEKSLTELQSALATKESKIIELEASLKAASDSASRLEETRAALETQLSEEKREYEQKLAEQKDELTTAYVKQGDLTRENESLATTQKDLTAYKSEAVKKITGLEKEIEELHPRIDTLNREVEKHKQAQEEATRLRQEVQSHQSIKQEVSTLTQKLSTSKRTILSLETERNELLSKVSELEVRTASAESSMNDGKLSQDALIRQLEEARQRLAESTSTVELLREELTDAQRQSQERLQETFAMRSLLSERDNNKTNNLSDMQRTIASLTEERNQLEEETQALSKRLLRDTNSLRSRVQDLQERLDASQREVRGYQDEVGKIRSSYDALKNEASTVHSNQDSEESLRHLRANLEKAEANARESARSSNLLKKMNSDMEQKLERLQKSHRALSDDLEQLREDNIRLRTTSPAPHNSAATMQQLPAESREKSAYIKNVLLGFLEHKDQRKQLLPVISTLLQFEGSDETRFWSSFA